MSKPISMKDEILRLRNIIKAQDVRLRELEQWRDTFLEEHEEFKTKIVKTPSAPGGYHTYNASTPPLSTGSISVANIMAQNRGTF